ncbi:glycosyltransferase [Nocardioides piscis]|uniref:Glycosyltransferase family 2 protein n=1 Tax=Nocardioides piscis TaxID=2714938 RepID=A0A6G7YJS9_9ACTN|nr:glycosyltransferase family 2 protein [Nocardioides piscis]QIK76988.1 glycosyltransferase family 2 protein [Nocardioides piscis]
MTGSSADRAARTGVVLVNHDSAEDTVGCIASLEASHDLDMDVVVVDNSDSETSRSALAALVGDRAVVLSSGGNLGYAGGSNVGIRHCLGRGNQLVWLLNPDTRVEPETLPRLIELLGDVRDCGVVGPRIVHPAAHDAEEIVWFDGGIVDEDKAGETRHLHQGRPISRVPSPGAHDVDYITGASLLTRRTVLETIGLLPEDYFLYFEETQWCRDVAAAGWRVMIEQRARMLHHQRSTGALPSPYHLYYMTRNRYLFVQRALGGDGEAALAQLRGKWLKNWRRKVAEHAPQWLPDFDALVEQAAADARAGRDGRNDDVSHVPWPDDVRRQGEGVGHR